MLDKMLDRIGAFDAVQRLVLLHDLQMGEIIRWPQVPNIPTGEWGVQVAGESDIRWVPTGNLYMHPSGVIGTIVEILPAYADDQLYAMMQRLRELEPDTARHYIDILTDAGFDVEYEDCRTLQGGMVVEFHYDVGPRNVGNLIIRSIAHPPSFCAKRGHVWDSIESNFDGELFKTCSHCGKSEKLEA